MHTASIFQLGLRKGLVAQFFSFKFSGSSVTVPLNEGELVAVVLL